MAKYNQQNRNNRKQEPSVQKYGIYCESKVITQFRLYNIVYSVFILLLFIVTSSTAEHEGSVKELHVYLCACVCGRGVLVSLE